MSFWGGPGGNVIVDPSGTPKTLVTHNHRVRKTSRNVENSHSGVTATNFEHLLGHYEGSFEVPWDDTNMPDVDCGLAEGSKVTIKFEDAASGKYVILTNALVESLEEVYDSSQNIIISNVSVKGGTMTRQVT